MEFVVKGRGIELDEKIKGYIHRKIKRKIDRFSNVDKVVKVEVELNFEKNPSINLNTLVEVTVFTAGAVIRATDSGSDAFEAIDRVGEKLERQIKKYKDRLIGRVRKVSNTKAGISEDYNQDIRRKIVRTKTFALKPMSPEEAVMQMELLGHDFFVFLNSESDKTAVVYRRKDSNYGLIESLE